VTNATRRQEEAVNLQGLFASHRKLIEQKKKKLPVRWPARNHGRVREEWRTEWHVGVPIKNLSAMIPKDRVISVFERGSVKVVPSKGSRVTSRSRNL